MEQKSFFRAIEDQNIQLVREMLAKDINVNALSPHGTALYRSVKLHNFELSKLLVENGADCNIVQLDFDRNEKHPSDGLQHLCFISTPIDLLCIDNEVINDKLLKYLLENRPMVTEDMINQRIRYCIQLFDDENHEMLFDYAASYFLRKNMYDHLCHIGENAGYTLLAATLNIDASFQRSSFTDGGTHEAFFALIVRSLVEELVRFKLQKSFHIVSEQQYTYVLHELIHNLEAYNLIMDICCISHEKIELFYPAIVKNITNKLKRMKNKEEYTLPIKWDEHAVCLNFVRTCGSIAIRIDNLSDSEKNKHETYTNKDKVLVIIPKIIGEIPLDKIDSNMDYFTSLVRCIKQAPCKLDGISILYDKTRLNDLDTSGVSEMTKQLRKQSTTLKCFIQQATSNCFFKSHEPGFTIRSNDYNISQKMVTVMGNYAMKLRTIDVAQKRNDFEHKLRHYWEKETTISEYIFGQMILLKVRLLNNYDRKMYRKDILSHAYFGKNKLSEKFDSF